MTTLPCPAKPRTGLVVTGHPRAGDAVRDGLGVNAMRERLQRKGLTYAGYDAWLKEEQDMITDTRDLTERNR